MQLSRRISQGRFPRTPQCERRAGARAGPAAIAALTAWPSPRGPRSREALEKRSERERVAATRPASSAPGPRNDSDLKNCQGLANLLSPGFTWCQDLGESLNTCRRQRGTRVPGAPGASPRGAGAPPACRSSPAVRIGQVTKWQIRTGSLCCV